MLELGLVHPAGHLHTTNMLKEKTTWIALRTAWIRLLLSSQIVTLIKYEETKTSTAILTQRITTEYYKTPVLACLSRKVQSLVSKCATTSLSGTIDILKSFTELLSEQKQLF